MTEVYSNGIETSPALKKHVQAFFQSLGPGEMWRLTDLKGYLVAAGQMLQSTVLDFYLFKTIFKMEELEEILSRNPNSTLVATSLLEYLFQNEAHAILEKSRDAANASIKAAVAPKDQSPEHEEEIRALKMALAAQAAQIAELTADIRRLQAENKELRAANAKVTKVKEVVKAEPTKPEKLFDQQELVAEFLECSTSEDANAFKDKLNCAIAGVSRIYLRREIPQLVNGLRNPNVKLRIKFSESTGGFILLFAGS